MTTVAQVLGLPVYEGGCRLGYVVDLRFTVEGSDLLLTGLLVGRRPWASFLGYERGELTAPWPAKRFLHWLHRGTRLIDWTQVEDVTDDGVQLRETTAAEFRSTGPRAGR